MKKMFLVSLILLFSAAASDAAYYNADIPPNAGTYNMNSGTTIGNTYYSWDNQTQSYTGYTRQGNNIYGSNGTQYTQFGNTIQNNATGETYQINNNIISPLH